MNILDFLRQRGIEPVKASSAKGGEYSSLCPACGDGGKGRASDRFRAWPEQRGGQTCEQHGVTGTYWCRRCGIRGDILQFVMDFDGKDFADACRYVGIDSPGPAPPPSKNRIRPAPIGWQPRWYDPPSDLWRKKAREFVDRCNQELLARTDQLGWLAARGVDEQTVRELKVGCNPKHFYRHRSAWGLPEEKRGDGQPKKLWIPRGIVIPFIPDLASGDVERVRIRRPKADLKTELDRKYYVVPGSGMRPMLLRPEAKAFVVIEAELDGLAVAAAAPADVGALALGSASTRPDELADGSLKKAVCILNALDFDRAGAENRKWWEENYPKAKRWPVPDAKDPGDAVLAGIDLCAWIKAGLPPVMTVRSCMPQGAGLLSVGAGSDDPSCIEKKRANPKNSLDGIDMEKIPELMDAIEELGERLTRVPIRIVATRNRISIQHAAGWMQPETWDRISLLVFQVDGVIDFLTDHPSGVITGKNFWGEHV